MAPPGKAFLDTVHQKTQSVVFTAKGLPLKQQPFILRNLSTNQTHRLRDVIFVGRSQKKLREGIDLRIDHCEISRIHCSIQVNENGIFLFPESDGSVHVDGIPVTKGNSKQMIVGTHIRFGETALWVVERASLFKPHKDSTEKDPLDLGEWIEVRIKNRGDFDTLRRCSNWLIFMEVLLDMTPECPQSAKVAPCVDAIQILDNAEPLVTIGPVSFEEMVDFDMSIIHKVMRGEGQVLRGHLSADPLKLAMVAKRIKGVV